MVFLSFPVMLLAAEFLCAVEDQIETARHLPFVNSCFRVKFGDLPWL